VERINLLLSKYLNNSCTKAELNEFIDWIKSPENEEELKNLIAKDWSTIQLHERYGEVSNRSFENLLKKIDTEKTTIRSLESKKLSKVLLRIAVSIILPVAIGLGSYYAINSIENSSNIASNKITAPKGSKTQVLLADGTSIWLNSGSTLEYPQTFKKKIREVKLTGEGYFDVAKNPDKPFVVKTSDLNIKVLGTIFNVKSYPEEGTIETTLLEGSVAISKLEDNLRTKNVVLLKPNERATFIKKEGKIIQSEVISRIPGDIKPKVASKPRKEQMFLSKINDSERYTSWKDERLTFRNENFEQLCIMLERWYNVKINIHSEELKTYHYTGTLQNENIVDAIETFKLTVPFRYEINQDIIEIWQTDK
jgi:ferric-dicitrate binding protein FerR (iron transport regulator)